MKKIICWLPLMLLLLNCSDEKYKLTLEVSGQGTYEVIPVKGEYDEGESVTLSAYPNSPWKFNKWEGSILSHNNPLQLIMDGNKTIQLIFSVPYNPSISGDWEGTEYTITFHVSQPDEFDSTLTGRMTAHLVNGTTVEYSVTGYNRSSVIVMHCKNAAYYEIIYTGWWANNTRINGGMTEAGEYYKCDLLKQGDSPLPGPRLAFIPKKTEK